MTTALVTEVEVSLTQQMMLVAAQGVVSAGGTAEASAAVSALKADPANYASVFAADLSAKCA